MSKTIQKPLNCRNARCGATCSIIEAEMWSDNPNKCPMFEYNPYIYDKAHDAKVRTDAIEELRVTLQNKLHEEFTLTGADINEVTEQLKEYRNDRD